MLHAQLFSTETTMPRLNTGRGAAQNQKSVHDQYTLDILAVHKNQYNQYIKNSNVLINQYTKNSNVLFKQYIEGLFPVQQQNIPKKAIF